MQSECQHHRKSGSRLDGNSYSSTQCPRSRASQRTAYGPCDEITKKEHRRELPVPRTEYRMRPRQAKQYRRKAELQQRIGTPRRSAVDCARDDAWSKASFHFMAQLSNLRPDCEG